MIGYYIHHHGSGHRSRAESICTHLRSRVTAITSLDLGDSHPFDEVLTLARDDGASAPQEPSAHGAFHWVPRGDSGLRDRMATIAQWVADFRPTAVVVDVSVEIATFVRLLGVPVIVMAMPGQRTDAPHALVYRLADHILAAWPRELAEPEWLRPYADKTTYVGGISRFDGRAVDLSEKNGTPTVLVLGGTGGSLVTMETVAACAQASPEFRWHTLGVPGGPWVQDPWPAICAADIVVTHAGQNCVADVAVAERPAIVIPQARPFDEQLATADVLGRHDLATVADSWPAPPLWPGLLDCARGTDPPRWAQWRTAGAAARAAEAIESVTQR